jgi:hypothetical protein
MPWPAGNHRSLERFLDEAEQSGVLDVIADHPSAATQLSQPPISLSAEHTGTVLRFAESREQGLAFPHGWKHWQQVSPDAATPQDFADFAETLEGEDWDKGGDAALDDVLIAMIDTVVAGRAAGRSARGALDARS